MDQDHHSSDAPLEPWVDPALEARLVALILGEASEFEEAELLSAIDSQPELKAFYERIKRTHRALELAESPTHSDSESSWKLPPAKREALLERFRSPADSATHPASIAEPVTRRRLRVAPWLAIAAAAALLMVTVIPLTLTRRAVQDSAMVRVAESQALEGLQSARFDVAEMAIDRANIAADPDTPAIVRLERESRSSSSLESLAKLDSDSKGGEKAPETWERFGNFAAWREPEAGEKAVVHESLFTDPNPSDGWEQGLSLATNARGNIDEGRTVTSYAVTAEPSQEKFIADGGLIPSINGISSDPSSPQQWGAKTGAALPSPTLRLPMGSASPEAAAPLTDLDSVTAGTDRLASSAVTAPVAFEDDFFVRDQSIPLPDAIGDVAQVETASDSDEEFVSNETKAYYKMPTGGRGFRSDSAPSPSTEDLALDLIDQNRLLSGVATKEEAVAPTAGQLFGRTSKEQSRPAIGLGMELAPPSAPEPADEPSPTAPVYTGGIVSSSGVVTGFAMVDDSATLEVPSPDPASADDPFGSEAEGMELADAGSLQLQQQFYSEDQHGDGVAGIGGGGIGGGGGRAGSQQESLQGLGEEVAQQRALYDDVARDFGKDGAGIAGGIPFATTATADFGWDSQPGVVTRFRTASVEEKPTATHWAIQKPLEGATRLAGDRVTQEMDAGVAFSSAFGASLPQPESVLSRRLIESEISQYGSAQDEAKLAEVLKSENELAKVDKFSAPVDGKVRGLGTLGLDDIELSQELLTQLGGDSLDGVINADGTVRMRSLANQLDGEGGTSSVEQKLAAILETDESEEEEKEVTRGGQALSRFFAESSSNREYDRGLALSEVEPRWEAKVATPGSTDLAENAPPASGGSVVTEFNRPEGAESSWYDFDVDAPGKEVTDLAVRSVIPDELQDGLAVAGGLEVETLREKKFADFSGADSSRDGRSTTTFGEPVGGAIVVNSDREEALGEDQVQLDERLIVAKERVSVLRSEARKQNPDKSNEQLLAGKLVATSGSERAKAKPDLSLETLTSAEPFSTFSLNVSDVSFKLAKTALLENNSFPDSAKVRVEEFVNAFDYGDPSPSLNEKVACHIDQSTHPFLQQRNLMRISMQTAAEGRAASQPLRLTILLDKSGSMERADREESVLRTMQALSTHLGPADTVTAVAFARQPHLIADQLSGDRAEELVGLVAATPSEGGTNLEEALALADELATRQFDGDAINRIVLITDGAANLGDADPESLKEKVSELRQRGIAFDACGVGANGLNDTTLEALTRKGDGRYYFLNRPQDADTKFVRQLAGALRPAAKNVKVQVKFNPERVTRYRLAGFEKHRLNKEDFRNDKVDAAEMAAAESGNALYQFEADPQGNGDVGEVSVRFLDTSGGKMVERSWPIPYQPNAPRLGEAAPAMQLAATAGLLGEKLKGGPSSETIVLGDLAPITNQLRTEFAGDQEVQQLLQMVEAARSLTGQ